MKMQIKFIIISVILFVILLCERTNGIEKLIVDTDVGGDDAVALSLLLKAFARGESKFNVTAITCIYGNTAEKLVEENVLKVLTVAKSSNILVYGGTEKPLIDPFPNSVWFGKDGFGDFQFNQTITGHIDNSTHAVQALINLAKQHSGDINILVLGPLTNIALAISLDPNFVNHVKKFYIMGGSVAGVGNKSPGVEFNFGIDPDSNLIVFNALRGKPAVLFPWETTVNAQIAKEWRMNILGAINSPIVNLLNNAEGVALSKMTIWNPVDSMAAAIMIWPELINKTIITDVTPVIDGGGRGTLLVDYSHSSGKKENAEIIQTFDVETFKKRLIANFS